MKYKELNWNKEGDNWYACIEDSNDQPIRLFVVTRLADGIFIVGIGVGYREEILAPIIHFVFRSEIQAKNAVEMEYRNYFEQIKELFG